MRTGTKDCVGRDVNRHSAWDKLATAAAGATGQGCGAEMDRSLLTRYAWLSIAAAVGTIALKTWAWWLTGSVGLLSDALESLVNLGAAVIALVTLTIAARPADDGHPYGYDKAEYFSSGAEGTLIFVAAVAIAATAVDRLLNPQPIEQAGLGLVVTALATLINGGVAAVLYRAGRRHDSITLEADAHHLMTDVWTSAGVIIGVGLVAVSGWQWLDPVIALAVAAHILLSGWRLMRRSVLGLLDQALPRNELDQVEGVLAAYRKREGIDYHALRTRSAASRRFLAVHILVPGNWTVQRGHDLAERIEADLHGCLSRLTVSIHLEPLEDPASLADMHLDRKVGN